MIKKQQLKEMLMLILKFLALHIQQNVIELFNKIKVGNLILLMTKKYPKDRITAK